MLCSDLPCVKCGKGEKREKKEKIREYIRAVLSVYQPVAHWILFVYTVSNVVFVGHIIYQLERAEDAGLHGAGQLYNHTDKGCYL